MPPPGGMQAGLHVSESPYVFSESALDDDSGQNAFQGVRDSQRSLIGFVSCRSDGTGDMANTRSQVCRGSQDPFAEGPCGVSV